MAGQSDQHISIFARPTAAAKILSIRLPLRLRNPVAAIVCGSGLGNLQKAVEAETRVEVPFEDVDGMPKLSVEGHEGKLIFGFMKGGTNQESLPVMLLVGRAHFYEGHTMEVITYATRLCRCLEIRIMIVTNAAGALNPEYRVGDLVLLNDHINLAGLAGMHPLRGPNEAEFGVRFLPLSDAYDLDLRRRAHTAWRSISSSTDTSLHEGVYAFVGGPSYETRAECRMLRQLGADLVGMSTVPEVITARHCGMRVLALSIVTNNAVLEAGPRGDDEALVGMNEAQLEEYLSRGRANHEEVLEAGRITAQIVQGLVVKVVEGLSSK